jgi:hypothetical protein
MRKPLVTILLFLAVAAIVGVVIADYLSSRPGKRPSNPFAYDVEEYMSLPAGLVSWREAGQVEIDEIPVQAMAFSGGNIYLAAGNELQVISENWNRIFRKDLLASPSCISVSSDGRVIIGFATYLAIMDKSGEIIAESAPLQSGSHITSVAEHGGNIYAADALARKVRIYNSLLEQTGEFSGESGVSDIHGFIVPGGHFSLAVNHENELWITNPGLHALQNYTAGGRLRSDIRQSSFSIEGFSGCCNPVHFAFMPGGEFVTSEKGIIRIKVLKESGELLSVVAPPEIFEGGTRAPAIAVDDNGNVLALDFDRNMIRFFEPI